MPSSDEPKKEEEEVAWKVSLSSSLCSCYSFCWFMFWLPTPQLYQQKCSTSKSLHKSFGGGQRPVFGTNKFSSREEEEADQSVVFRNFSSDYLCDLKRKENSFSSSFRRRKWFFYKLVVPQCKKSFQHGFRRRRAIKYERLQYGDPQR